jgi:hypothetical protein
VDRVVVGTTWGVAIAHDPKRRNAAKWERVRRRELRTATPNRAASAANLERQISALAVANPEYVVVG